MKKSYFAIFLVFSFFLVFSCSKKSDSKNSSEEQKENFEKISENSSLLSSQSSQSEKDAQAEAERLENEILKSVENFSEAQIEYNSLESESENSEDELPENQAEEETKDVFVVDNNGKLKIYSFEGEGENQNKEILIPEKEDGFTVLTSANKKIITRSFYDDFGRFCKKEEWKIPDVENPSLEKSTIYEYDGENFSPTKKIILEKNYKTEFEYDKNENPIKMAKFYILQTEEDSKSFLINQTEYSYDDEQKIISEKTIEKTYSEDYKKENSSLEKKFLYSYPNVSSEDEIPADFSYFENGILRIKNEYSSEKGSYVSQVFFDENYSVKTYYKENQKKKDVYILDGKVVREKNYD